MSKLTPVEELKLLRESLSKQKCESKKVIRVCATGCRAKGADSIVKKFRELISPPPSSSPIKGEGLNEEDVEIRETGCHGFCAAAPVVVTEPEGIFYPSVKEEDVQDILEKTVIRGEVINSLLWKDPATGKRVKSEKNIPFYKNQTKFILDLCGKIDPQEIRDYILNDGYSALAKVLTGETPESVIEEIRAAKLRGRGGAGFPTGLKWELTRKANGDKKYIICNADEGDPGAFMDRALLEGNPHAIIEGMLIAAYAIGANNGYIYVRAEYPIAIKHLKLALKHAKELGLLGENILNTGFNLNIILKEGAGAFVCGEETALIASIEGKRGMPKPRPPFPAQSGLWNKPTCINNVETLANVPKIILNGAEKYKALGTEKSGGTKIFSLAGKVKNSGLVEVPIGTPLKKLVFDIGGGIPRGRKFKAIQTGGPSGGCIPAKYLDTPIDYETLTQLGSIMGSGGMIVLDDNTCMVDIAHYFLSFTQSESCGKCVPCRIGTKRMLEILTRIKEGKGEEDDLDKLIELAEIIKDSALCGLGQTAPNPVLTTIKYFRDEYEAHIKEKRCPAGTCEAIVYAPCQHICPLGTDVPGYITLIAEEKFRESLELIREHNPLPGICGRVCHHPCELKCRRGEVDEPIAIAALKRFAADYESRQYKRRTSKLGRGLIHPEEKVAVIGSGPGGLTCAYHLIRKGFPVTIFESLPVAGGMLSAGIPEYRLPREILNYEIERIVSLGVEIKTEVRVGKDITIDELLHQGYKAIFVAVGAHGSRKLGIPGEDADGVIDGIKFLRDMNLSLPKSSDFNIGRKVVVIGGGNVAVDSARSALRLGSEVTIVYRRSREEMPALVEEVEASIDEGIEILYLTIPKRIISESGKVKGLECIRAKLGEMDESGRRRPVPIPDSNFLLEVDTVIPAIGQHVDNTFTGKKTDIEFTKAGTLKVDPFTLATSVPGIFAGGDAVSGPSTVIESMAAGKIASFSIIQYLKGEPVRRIFTIKEKPQAIEREEEIELGEKLREKVTAVPAKKRIHNFSEAVKGYTRKKAVREANRCLKCHLGL